MTQRQSTGPDQTVVGLSAVSTLKTEWSDVFFDEAYSAPGVVRDHYASVLPEFDTVAVGDMARAVAAELASAGCSFTSVGGPQPFLVDPVPRIIPAHEWDQIELGLRQRVKALEAFVDDVYGSRLIVDSGVIPSHVVDSADYYEPVASELPVPAGGYIGVAGLDLVRAPSGDFQVIEDNLRTPSGVCFALAARRALDHALAEQGIEPPAGRLSLDAGLDFLLTTLRASAPGGNPDPTIVVVSDGPSNSAWFEHNLLAAALGLPIVSPADLVPRGQQMYARIDGLLRQVDVIYRRTDVDRLTEADGTLNEFGKLLIGPLRAGTLAVVNAFGTGVADDKLAHVYVEEMVRFYLGEEPRLKSAQSYDLAVPESLALALDRLDELVFKPRSGHGGHGVVICPHATQADRDQLRATVTAAPHEWIAQETVWFSRHPTVIDGVLAPRHVDLRPFVYNCGGSPQVFPGGLTRVAFDRDALVVNTSQNGGGKDTWVLS